MSKRTPTLEVFDGKAVREGQETGGWYWRLRSRNGEIVCQSEGYSTKQGAKRAARRLAAIAALAVLS